MVELKTQRSRHRHPSALATTHSVDPRAARSSAALPLRAARTSRHTLHHPHAPHLAPRAPLAARELAETTASARADSSRFMLFLVFLFFPHTSVPHTLTDARVRSGSYPSARLHYAYYTPTASALRPCACLVTRAFAPPQPRPPNPGARWPGAHLSLQRPSTLFSTCSVAAM